MARNIEKIAEGLGARVVGRVPANGGAFGAARLARIVEAMQSRLEPGQGQRPGRPTDASWVRHPKVPMSDLTKERLTRWPSNAARGDARSARCRSPLGFSRRPWRACRSLDRKFKPMKDFAELYTALDETTKTGEKVEALTRYFAHAAPADAAWAVYFLIGRKPKQVVPSKKLREWAAEAAAVPDWLFDESYDAVGDVAETVALLLPTPDRSSDLPLSYWVEKRLLPLRDAGEEAQHAAMIDAWRAMDRTQRFVWNKLISGGFRVGVSQQLVTRALARVSGVEAAIVAHRLMGDWEPTPAFYDRLRRTDARDADHSRPYPFCLAHALEAPPESLGAIEDWQAEWKWDGIRAQLIRRDGDTFLWTRGEELVTDRYPELATLGAFLPEGTVLDGEILPWLKGSPLPFAQLQRRIGRKTLGKTILAEVPVVLIAYDLIEFEGKDLRTEPFESRRNQLAKLVESLNLPDRLILSPIVEATTWEDLTNARAGVARPSGGGPDAQAAGVSLPRWPEAGRLVEVEGQPVHDRRRPDRRAARERQARQPLHRLHLQRLGRRRPARDDRQGVFGIDR